VPEKNLIELFNLIALAALVFVPFLGSKRVGILALSLIACKLYWLLPWHLVFFQTAHMNISIKDHLLPVKFPCASIICRHGSF
jgi:hypothetical protein